MKAHINYRLIALLLFLAAFGIREIMMDQQPSFLRPGLHLFAYIGNTKDGTVTAVDLIKLSPMATVAVGAGPSGIRAHPSRKEIWGLSSVAGYVWVLDVETNQIVARIPVGPDPYALDFSPDGLRAYVAASGSNTVVEIDCGLRKIIAHTHTGRRPWIARVSPSG